MQIFRNAENYMVNILGLEMEDKGVYALPVPVSHFFEVRKSLIGGHEFLLLSPTMEDVKPELLCTVLQSHGNVWHPVRIGRTDYYRRTAKTVNQEKSKFYCPR